MYTCIAIRPKYVLVFWWHHTVPFSDAYFQNIYHSVMSYLIIHPCTANQANGVSVGHSNDVPSQTQTFSVFFAASSQKAPQTPFNPSSKGTSPSPRDVWRDMVLEVWVVKCIWRHVKSVCLWGPFWACFSNVILNVPYSRWVKYL